MNPCFFGTLAEWEMNQVWKLWIQIVIDSFGWTHSNLGARRNKTSIPLISMMHPNTCLPCPGLWEPVICKSWQELQKELPTTSTIRNLGSKWSIYWSGSQPGCLNGDLWPRSSPWIKPMNPRVPGTAGAPHMICQSRTPLLAHYISIQNKMDKINSCFFYLIKKLSGLFGKTSSVANYLPGVYRFSKPCIYMGCKR